jgi:pimeloyl-ACP methyl ester carboxylesterase
MIAHFFYLHGWASCPASFKARWCRERFSERGLTLHAPDLNQNDFYHLTLSRQLAQVTALLPADGPVALIGSSFGALTALWLAQKLPRIQALLLLAPAINFPANIRRQLGEAGLAQWQSSGKLKIQHPAWQREAEIAWEFVEDMQAYPDAGLRRELPTLILHGRDDAVIPLADVASFAAERPWIRLESLDGDHSLGQTDWWSLAGAFLHKQCGLPL